MQIDMIKNAIKYSFDSGPLGRHPAIRPGYSDRINYRKSRNSP